MPNLFQNPRVGYDPKRDGTLEHYLQTHSGGSNPYPLFRGYKWYKELKKQEFLIPEVSVIRIMYNVMREDEHYLVNSNYNLVGIQLSVHSGQEGIHDPKDLLKYNGPLWEAQHVAPTPEIRQIYKNLLKNTQ